MSMDSLDAVTTITMSTTAAAAYSQHDRVPADRWCVTLADLTFLRRELQRAIQCGELEPPDDGDTCYIEYGPTMHTVNEQYIKPVTFRAGKISWALMRHEDGLDCNLFISHAWLEGVFEFLSKVRNSWPRGLQHAWCCVLANPQNLNIESFLASPTSSPFAVALRASQIVLAVPNRRASIYSRLWCAYEAYLAEDEGKTIVIATASHFHHHLKLLLRMGGAAIAGACLGRALFFFKIRHPMVGAPTLIGCSSLLSMLIGHNELRMVLNCFGQAVVWFQLTNSFRYFTPKEDEILQVSRVCFWLTVSMVFCAMDFDRVQARCAKSEAKLLRRGYTGVEDAECSQAADERAIRSEIGNRADAVNHAIEVLMTAGMSTQNLRDLDRAGVNIKGAAFSEVTGAVICLGPFPPLMIAGAIVDIVDLGGYWWFLTFLPSLAVLGRVALIVLLCRKPRDEQCFLLKVMSKFMAGSLTLFAIGVAFCHAFGFARLAFLLLTISDLSVLAQVYVVFLGIGGMAKFSFGRSVLQVIFWRKKDLCPACECDLSESESDDDGSSDGGE